MAREESTLDLNQLSDDDGFSDNEYSSSNAMMKVQCRGYFSLDIYKKG